MNDLNNGIELLHTGMSDNANLMTEDQLGELFGGYCTGGYCQKNYDGFIISCPKSYCGQTYYKD